MGSFFSKKPKRLRRGRPWVYSDAAISAIAVLRTYFNLPYRQTEGLARRVCLPAWFGEGVKLHNHLQKGEEAEGAG